MAGSKDKTICQMGVVVRDVRQAVANYRALGMGPWDIHIMSNATLASYKIDDREVREPYEYLIALSNFNNIQIELMQPVKGPNLYWDFLEQKGEGLHHVKEYVPGDIRAVVDSYIRRGIRVLGSGQFGEDLFFYLDTEKELGIMLELGNNAACPPPVETIPL